MLPEAVGIPLPPGDGALHTLLRRGARAVGRAVCAPVSLFAAAHGRAGEAAHWPARRGGGTPPASDTARALADEAVAHGVSLRRDGYLALLMVGEADPANEFGTSGFADIGSLAGSGGIAGSVGITDIVEAAGVVVVHPQRLRHGRPRAPVTTRAVANAARVVADTLAAHERALVAEGTVARYERWFDTQDRHIRVLDRERQKFAALVNQSGTSCYVTDANGRISWTNKTLADSGVANGESWTGQLCRAACASLAGGEAFACQDCPVDAAIACGGVVRRELRADGAHGSRTLYVTAVPVPGAPTPSDFGIPQGPGLPTDLGTSRRQAGLAPTHEHGG